MKQRPSFFVVFIILLSLNANAFGQAKVLEKPLTEVKEDVKEESKSVYEEFEEFLRIV